MDCAGKAMTSGQVLLLIITGTGAGMLNAAVGSGTLITYPALLTIGLPPVAANATNAFGMAAGNFSASFVYRSYLRGRKPQLIKWCLATGIGAVAGAVLVVALPSSVFAALVPWLILSAVVLIAVQPWLTKTLQNRSTAKAVTPVVALVGMYGGYFGAGQGMGYLAALGSLDGGDIQRTNAVKNLLATAANGAAAVTFLLAGRVVLLPAVIVAISALFGGLAGGGIAKRLPQWLLRTIIVVVGIYAAGYSFWSR